MTIPDYVRPVSVENLTGPGDLPGRFFLWDRPAGMVKKQQSPTYLGSGTQTQFWEAISQQNFGYSTGNYNSPCGSGYGIYSGDITPLGSYGKYLSAAMLGIRAMPRNSNTVD